MTVTTWQLLRNYLHRPCNVVCFIPDKTSLCQVKTNLYYIKLNFHFPDMLTNTEINIKLHLLQIVKLNRWKQKWNLPCYTSCDHNSYFAYHLNQIQSHAYLHIYILLITRLLFWFEIYKKLSYRRDRATLLVMEYFDKSLKFTQCHSKRMCWV